MAIYEVKNIDTNEPIGFTDDKGLEIFLQFYRKDNWEPQKSWIPASYLNFNDDKKVYVGNKIDDRVLSYSQ